MRRWLCMIAGIGLLTCLLVGCRTSHQLTVLTGDELISAKLKVQVFAADERESYSGTLKLKRNERLRISLVVPVARTEAARIELTQERLLVIDRINRKYADLTVEEVNRHLGLQLSLADLQERMLGKDYPRLPSKKKVILNTGREHTGLQFDLTNIKATPTELPPAKLPKGYDQLTWNEIEDLLAP